jgi:hypothetical protein
MPPPKKPPVKSVPPKARAKSAPPKAPPKAPSKPRAKSAPNLIAINSPKSVEDFKVENKAIYIIRSEHCFYCRNMREEWDKATADNKNIKIYEIEAEYLNEIPPLKKIVQSFPTIFRYNNGFKPYNNARTSKDLSFFMRNG